MAVLLAVLLGALLVNVIKLVESIQRGDAKERRRALPRFDEDLAKAVSEDMADYMGEAMSSIAFRSKAPGVHSIRTKQVFTRFGWCEVRHPYRVGSPEGSDVFKAFGFSYSVTDLGIGELTSLVHEQAVARGSGTVPRVQCVADGEEALENAMRDALPFAEFTNDFMHAAGYLNTCCEKLGIADAAKEFRTCRAI